MDGTYLSDATVVAASRKFVCARLLTYESAEEAEFLTSIFTGRSGELENSTFAILAPDGKTKLARAGRSPDFLFRTERGRGPGRPSGDAADLTKVLEDVSKKYPGDKRAIAKTATLPLLEDVRAGLNVAACDRRPLVVVVGDDDEALRKLEAAVAEMAWSEQVVGRFVYASTTKAKDLESIDRRPKQAQVLVVAPDTFGVKGTVLASVRDATQGANLRAALEQALDKWSRPEERETRTHVREGNRAGVHWETEIPVTDPGRPPGGHRAPPGR